MLPMPAPHDTHLRPIVTYLGLAWLMDAVADGDTWARPEVTVPTPPKGHAADGGDRSRQRQKRAAIALIHSGSAWVGVPHSRCSQPSAAGRSTGCGPAGESLIAGRDDVDPPL